MTSASTISAPLVGRKSVLHKLRRRTRSALVRSRGTWRFRSGPTVLVTGAGRAGTTWVGEIVAELTGGALFFEPDNPKRGLMFSKLVDAERSVGSRVEMYQWLAQGKGANNWSVRNLGTFLSSKRLILKSIAATDVVPELVRASVFDSPVVVVRHPCAVVASQIMAGFSEPSVHRAVERHLDRYPHLAPLLDIATDHERYAAQWALTYMAVAAAPDSRVLVVEYERFVDDPSSNLERLGRHLGISGLDVTDVDIDRPSIMDYRDDLRQGREQLTKWQDRLDETQVREILEVVRTAGIYLYDESAMPGEGSLRLDLG